MTNHLCAVSVLHSGMHRDLRFRSMNRWAGGINRWVSEQPVKLMRRALRCRLALGMWLAYPCAKGGSHENQDECEGWHVHLLRTAQKNANSKPGKKAASGGVSFFQNCQILRCASGVIPFRPRFLINRSKELG